jgi:eukaryotic-like serine/threonine-protein kinase
MNELKTYLKSKLFLKNLLKGISSVIVIVILLMLFIRIYSHHNRTIKVPDFTDLPVSDAEKYIKQRHLRYEIFDSIYIAEKEKGVIIDQHPKPGFLVKKNRIVYFTINASSPDKILMPELAGITLREARSKIIAAGLKIGNLTYRFDIAKNVVLDQQVKGIKIFKNDTVLKGTQIDLVLGKGLADERSMVPDLTGLTTEQAKNKASDNFFSLGAIIRDESITEENEKDAVIFRQRPASSSDIMAPLGSPIDLWITADSVKIAGGEGTDSTDYIWQDLNKDNNAKGSEDDSYNDDYN